MVRMTDKTFCSGLLCLVYCENDTVDRTAHTQAPTPRRGGTMDGTGGDGTMKRMKPKRKRQKIEQQQPPTTESIAMEHTVACTCGGCRICGSGGGSLLFDAAPTPVTVTAFVVGVWRL